MSCSFVSFLFLLYIDVRVICSHACLMLLAMLCSDLCVCVLSVILHVRIHVLPCLHASFHMFTHVLPCPLLDLCFHMLVCLDLRSLHALCACALHAMFVCLGLDLVCHAMCYCCPFFSFHRIFLCFGLLVWT